MTPNFIYKLKVRQLIKQVKDLKKEKDYEEFVKKADERIALWNRVLHKPKKIGVVSNTF